MGVYLGKRKSASIFKPRTKTRDHTTSVLLSHSLPSQMERSPVITWLFHIRAMSLFFVLLLVDYLFIKHSWSTLYNQGPSVDIVFGLEVLAGEIICRLNLSMPVYTVKAPILPMQCHRVVRTNLIIFCVCAWWLCLMTVGPMMLEIFSLCVLGIQLFISICCCQLID